MYANSKSVPKNNKKYENKVRQTVNEFMIAVEAKTKI